MSAKRTEPQSRLVALEAKRSLLQKQRQSARTEKREEDLTRIKAELRRLKHRIRYYRNQDAMLVAKKAYHSRPAVQESRREYNGLSDTKARRRCSQRDAYHSKPDLRSRRIAGSRRHRELKPEQHKAAIKLWKKKHPGYGTAWCKRRKQTHPSFALECRFRSRVAHALKGTCKSAKTRALLGCSFIDLVKHIESLFLPGMSWENRHLWHVDHKRPVVDFDLCDPEQQHQCFNYRNLQPLWAIDNLKKGRSLEAAKAAKTTT